MAKAMTKVEMVAMAKWAALNKVSATDPKLLEKYKAYLASQSGEASPGQRGRVAGALTRAFMFDGEGNLVGEPMNVLASQAGRASAAVSAIMAHGEGKIDQIVFTRSFGPTLSAPKLTRIVTPDGKIVEGYLADTTSSLTTGEESPANPDLVSEDSEDSAPHAAE